MRDCEKDCSNYNSKWSQEENKLFEVALAIIDEKCPKRWEWVAFMIGNKKTAEEVQKHFEMLLEDLNFIESCSLIDHKHDLEISDVSSCHRQDQEQSRMLGEISFA
ncbi:protein RADIALIS-like 4 [Carex littledalei]|uniref:Protein RADIALIS-like 4 n=1 Tax=Carex littledalei TaxID=544730 RepID=A0A833RFT3_9POAL|nr:protein RADIALIS-like 4 [Carex littledalei]